MVQAWDRSLKVQSRYIERVEVIHMTVKDTNNELYSDIRQTPAVSF